MTDFESLTFKQQCIVISYFDLNRIFGTPAKYSEVASHAYNRCNAGYVYEMKQKTYPELFEVEPVQVSAFLNQYGPIEEKVIDTWLFKAMRELPEDEAELLYREYY